MFDGIGPKLKNLLPQSNIWIGVNTFKKNAIATTTFESIKLRNETAATATITVQEAPTLNYKGSVWVSDSLLTKGIESRSVLTGVSGASYLGNGILRTQLFKEGDGWRTATDLYNRDPSGNNGSKLIVYGAQDLEFSHGNQDPATSTVLMLNNTSGQYTSQAFKFAGTIKSAITVQSAGGFDFKTINGTQYNFNFGGTISSQSTMVQIYSGGIYNTGGCYNQNRVTAGSGDVSVQTTLSTYGSLAVKGVLVTNSSYTLASTETFVYVDPSNANLCLGTAVSCATYTSSGTCGAHSAVGCTWNTGFNCSDYTSTDESTCLSGHTGCSWDSASCSPANNVDSTTCTNQNSPYGGTCAWDTGVCPAFDSNQGGCQGTTGCTWNFSDCTTFNGGSQGTCEGNTGCTWFGANCSSFNNSDASTCTTGHTGCTWDAAIDCHTLDATDQATCEAATGCAWNSDDSTCYGICAGQYDEGSTCTGSYNTSCTGDICTGTYNTGVCSGLWGAACEGTANCQSLGTSGACAAESGCTWTVGITVTLPLTSDASRGSTGRVYSIMHIGNTGTATIVGQTGQPIFQYTTLPLLKKGDKVLLHNQSITQQCSVFGDSTSCSAQTGCTWNVAIVCSTYNGDETGCNNAGCTWNIGIETCTGAGSAANCSGTYNSGAHWYAHSLERGLSYVEKTASYTVTSIDDTINCTSGTFALTLPSAPLNNGKVYNLKNTGTGIITINTTSSQTIDGIASGILTLIQNDNMQVQSNNTNWVRI